MEKSVRILLLIGVGLGGVHPGFSQILARAQQIQPREVYAKTTTNHLTDVLRKLQDHYDTDILFFDRNVEGLVVAADAVDLKARLEENLSSILKPLGLRYKKVKNGSYVVIGKSSAGKEEPNTARFPVGASIVAEQSEPEPQRQQTVTPALAELSAARVQVVDVLVQGTVSDEKGEGLPGVSILLKGTQKGTTTDADGRYKLDVPNAAATLIFSFVGYTSQEIVVGNRTSLNVTLTADDKTLNEVVVIGYGAIQKKDLTGSVASVGSKSIQEMAAPRIDQALIGKVAGVQVKPVSGEPGAAPQIRIRGIGSISAGAGPLYVVDGFPISSIQNLNPNDVETIDVLKDASATAIYGSRGANGVVIINTKRGKLGKAAINLSYQFGFQKIAKRPVLQTGLEEAQHYYDGVRNRNLDEGNDVSGDPLKWKAPVPQTILDVLSGKLTTNEDPLDAILRTASQQQYQLTASGGSENMRYAIGGEFFNQDGIILNTNFKRYSVRANLDAKLSPKLSLKVNLNPSYTDKLNVGGAGAEDIATFSDITNNPLYNALVIPPYQSLYNPDGSYYPFGNGLDAVVTSKNPLALANEIKARQKSVGFLGNTFLEYAILDNLKVNVMLGINLMSIKGSYFKPQMAAFLNELASGTDNASQRLNWITETTVNYTKSFGKHNFTGLLGYTTQRETFESNTLTSNRYPNNLVPTLSAVSGILTGGSSNVAEWSLLSYLGRINYNYNSKYYVTASMRTDGSSRFGAQNKYGLFPSFALAWRVSDENFMKDFRFVSELKLRTSYGKTGNNNIGNYDHLATINYEKYVLGGTGVGGFSPGRLSNPNLTWETQQQVNVGLDVSFLNNRLALTLDHFLSKNTDLLLNVNIPDITGFNTALQNIGEVKNTGWELTLNTVNTQGAFKWQTALNFSAYKNEVVRLGSSGDPIISGGNITQIGQPIGMFYGWLADGIFKTKAELDKGPLWNPGGRDASRVGDVRFVDVSGPNGTPDGVINSLDRTIMGSPYPDFYYGMTNSFSYKNLSLSISLQGVQGNDVLALSRDQMANNRARFRQYAFMNDYWKSEADPGNGYSVRPNDVPTGNFRGLYSQRWLDDGSYLRINNINVGYALPENIARKARLSSVRLSVTANNPFLFTKFIGFNPDVSRSDSPLTPGNERYDYPTAKSILFGINIGF
ncbi:SusC/RagA family TonB-linked outer membrane protein [Spirosoma validum]|uniref:TonB-dependent receptor n=1 Tax=Spirosoma validum TaxID=2771355 RepID=A0A927AWT7_9BACT|nr:TonB-dependent receptor [Spirosoma validum]MBD2751259.1 TonB-dependent receptor [Spirosoma validum]